MFSKVYSPSFLFLELNCVSRGHKVLCFDEIRKLFSGGSYYQIGLMYTTLDIFNVASLSFVTIIFFMYFDEAKSQIWVFS